MNLEPPAKRFCDEQNSVRPAVRDAPSLDMNNRLTEDELDHFLTQPSALEEIDKKVAEAQASKSSNTVKQFLPVKPDAVLNLQGLSQFGPLDSGNELEDDSALLLRAAEYAEEELRLRNETEKLKRKLLDAETENRTKDGELTILRCRLATSEKEKSELRKQIHEICFDGMKKLDEEKKKGTEQIKQLEDQLKFQEREKQSMEDRLKAKPKDDSVLMSQMDMNSSQSCSRLPSRSQAAAGCEPVLVAETSVYGKKSSFPSRRTFFENVAQSQQQGAVDMDISNEFVEASPSPEIPPQEMEDEVQTEEIFPTRVAKDCCISDLLEEGEILARYAVNLRNSSEEDYRNTLKAMLTEKKLGDFVTIVR